MKTLRATHAVRLSTGAAAVLAAAAAAIAAQEPEAEPKGPMTALSRLVGGEWHVAGEAAKPAFHHFQWGVGQRAITMETYAKGEDEATLSGHGVLFWHPGEESYRGLAFTPNGDFRDSLMEVDGETWNFDFEYTSYDSVHEFREVWKFDGEDAYDSKLYLKFEGGQAEASATRFERRRTDSNRVMPEEKGKARKLAPLERLAGHDWEVDGAWSDGSPVHAHTAYEWGLGRSYVVAQTHAIGENGEETHLYDTYYFWYPKKKSIWFTSVSATGEVYEGPLEVQDDTFAFEFVIHGEGEPKRLTQQLVFKGKDRFLWKVWRADDGELMVEAPWTKRKKRR